ncbi:MAG: HAD-IIIA family hydrolase [Nitrososphaerota archaeon]|nr:HAD-IIIA family hydrolase [Nitrososphaerota archaeon]
MLRRKPKALRGPRRGTTRKPAARGRERPRRAVFLDRDGVLNDLEYNDEEGQIGSPLSVRQLRVAPHAGEAVRKIKELGYLTVLVSNQPGVAKRQLTLAEFARMGVALRRGLAEGGGTLDGEYYCLHHPDALVARYKEDCACRKPKPGLLLRAAREMRVEMEGSFFVGDALADVKAGRAAGCRTILLGHVTSFLAKMIEAEGAEPDYVVHSLREVPELLRSLQ